MKLESTGCRCQEDVRGTGRAGALTGRDQECQITKADRKVDSICSDEDIRVLRGSSGAAEASLLSMDCVKYEQRTCSERHLPAEPPRALE